MPWMRPACAPGVNPSTAAPTLKDRADQPYRFGIGQTAVSTSSTRMIANKQALADPIKKRKIDELVVLMQAVLDARDRVMVEMNIPGDKLELIVRKLPCMRAPTVAPLFNGEGYAIKIKEKKQNYKSHNTKYKQATNYKSKITNISMQCLLEFY